LIDLSQLRNLGSGFWNKVVGGSLNEKNKCGLRLPGGLSVPGRKKVFDWVSIRRSSDEKGNV
jgi:hypothetical protein